MRFRRQERTSRETSSLWRNAFVEPSTAISSCRSALVRHSSIGDRFSWENGAMLLVVIWSMRSDGWMDSGCGLIE